jgi:hypothetical protein
MKLAKSKLKEIIKEEMTRVKASVRGGLSEGGELQNTAKGAAMSLLDTAKVMEQAPSHEPASLYAQEVAKQANLIMDMLVDMEPPEKKKLAEGVSKKQLARAIKIITEEITVDGKKIGPKAEAWLKKKLSANPKTAKAFGLKGGKGGGEAPPKVEDSPVEKAIDKVADNPKELEKALKNPKADAAMDAQVEKEKEIVKSAFDQAMEGQDTLRKEIAKSQKESLEKLIQSNELGDKFRANPNMDTLQAFQKVWNEKNNVDEEISALQAQWRQQQDKIKSDVTSGKLEEFLSLINQKRS